MSEQHAITDLIAMPAQEFEDAVADALRSQDRTIFEPFTSEELIERTAAAIKVIKTSIDGQLAFRKEYAEDCAPDDLADYIRWRRGALRFKETLETTLARLQPQVSASRLRVERDNYIVKFRLLAKAVRLHREQLSVEDDDITDADEKLWDMLEELETSLAQAA